MEHLTPEGQELWNNLDNPEYLNNLAKGSVEPKIKKAKKSNIVEEELRKYIKNQKQVIEQLKFEIDKITPDSSPNEMRQAARFQIDIRIHELAIHRMERIADGFPAFDEGIDKFMMQK